MQEANLGIHTLPEALRPKGNGNTAMVWDTKCNAQRQQHPEAHRHR
jgi:hypothetical protein